jgi:hypothetical protein
MKTIDVLDALRSQHALEISVEEHSKMKLVHEVDRWRTVAKNLELEKDELKDVVEDLIEKGVLSGQLVSQVIPERLILPSRAIGGLSPIYKFKSRTNGVHGRAAGCT